MNHGVFAQPSRSITQNDEELEQSRLLEQVVAKVVRVPQRVGVSPKDIASLLDSEGEPP
jgi:hypothetical protein